MTSERLEIDVAGAIRVCDLFDKPLVLSFWFTKGGDCEAQQDVFSAVTEEYAGRVNFLSIDIRDDRDEVRDLVTERGWEMDVGYDHDGAVAALYRIGGCPTFLYVYPGGIVQTTSIGEIDLPEMSAKIKALIADSAKRSQGAAG